MTYLPNEKELLRIHPQFLKIFSILLLTITFLTLYLQWYDIIEHPFKMVDKLFFLLAAISCLFPRIILTTHRIIYRFGPFFSQEIEKSKVHDIKITPPLKYLQIASSKPKPLWYQNFFKRLQRQDHPEYWFKHGLLFFVHQEKFVNFPTKHLRAISLSILSSAQFNQLSDYLLQHWGFDAHRVDFTPLEPFNFHDSMIKDIGKTALILLFCACLIGTLSLILPKFQGLHFGIESYLWLLPFVVIGIILSYLLIKQENKSYPIPSAIFVGSILGASLYFCTLQLNRIYSENYAITVPIKMTLIEVYRGSQIWHLDKEYAQNIGLNEIYVHQHWQGYNTHAQEDKTYNILVKKGLFNDYFIDQQSFSNISNQLDTE